MRKLTFTLKILVLSGLLLFIPLTANLHLVKAESANSVSYPVVKILSPTNTTYNSKFLTLNVTFPDGGLQYTLTYSIDEKYQGSIPWAVDNQNSEFQIVYTAVGTVTLPELSEGSHHITAKIVCGLYDFHGANPPSAPFKPTSIGSSDYEASWIDTVYFTINSVQTVKAQQFLSSVYIRPDGSVEPSTAPISHVRDSYRLTGNLYDTLIVERNNIVIDGSGFSLQGPGVEHDTVAINLTCTNTTIRNFNIKGWSKGVLGVFNNNTISNNNFTSNKRDVAIYADDYNVIGNYIVHGGALGTIFRIVGKNNVISQNQIHSLTYSTAFWISNSSGTRIEANNVTFSKLSTFFISTDNGNFRVFHNNFLNVEENTGGYLLLIVSFTQRTDVTSPPWDNGYPSGGNYWSDYMSRNPYAKEIENSGIGNTPYVSTTTSTVVDRYPLVEPFKISYVPEIAAPRISLSSPLNQTYNESSVSLVFAVDVPVNWTGYSLDGKDNVTVAGNTTLTGLTNGSHNVTVYATNEVGYVGAPETIIFTVTVPEPFPTTLEVASVSGASAILTTAGLVVYLKKRKH